MEEEQKKHASIPRPALIAIIASVAAVVLLAAGIAVAVLATGGPSVKLPTTEAALRASVDDAQAYLTPRGRILARGKTEGLTVYSVRGRLDQGRSVVTGDENLLFTNGTGSDLSELVFRVYSNSASVRGANSGPVSITRARAGGATAKTELKGSLLTLTLPRRLPRGESVVIGFSFEEPVPEISSGVGALIPSASTGGYGVFGHSDRIYDLGYWIPTVASFSGGNWESREVPPFGDVADFDCAYYNVAFDVPERFVVASTGIKKSEKAGGGRRVYGFAAGPARDFSVQASPDYKVSTRTEGPTTINSYYLASSKDAGARLLGYATNAFKQYSKHIGPYPYRTLNLCEATLTGGAAGMEFTGQILIGQLLYGELSLPGLDAPGELKDLGNELGDALKPLEAGILGDTLEFVAAHEVCHQWFGIVVGSDSIAHPWQDESLVNYCSVLYFRWRHGDKSAAQALQDQLVLPFETGMLTGGKDMPADSPVTAFQNEQQYTAVVYGKGALFFNELEKQMGARTFEKSLSQYYRDCAFKNAKPGDLLSAFEDNAKDASAVASLHQRWILEAHGEEDIAAAAPDQGPLNDLLDSLRGKLGVDLGPLKDFLDNLRKQGGMDLQPLKDLLDNLLKGQQTAPGAPGQSTPTLPGAKPSPVI
jgi:hypothetical protein